MPDGLKAEVLRLSHDIKLTGHPGVARTMFRLRERYIWYGLRKDCEMYAHGVAVKRRHLRQLEELWVVRVIAIFLW